MQITYTRYKLQEEKTVYLNIKIFPLDDSIIHCVLLTPGVLNTYKLCLYLNILKSIN